MVGCLGVGCCCNRLKNANGPKPWTSSTMLR